MKNEDVMKALKELADKVNAEKNHPCPHCGHCPTCGRGGYRLYPWYPPYYVPPIQPYWNQYEITSTSSTGTEYVTYPSAAAMPNVVTSGYAQWDNNATMGR